ncbi:inorganic phosphate cotransporter, partial [Nephila pilipes]
MSSIGGFVASFMCKWLTKKNYLQIDKTRKAFTFAGAFGFSMCMLGIILAGCDTVINILCFTLSLFITGMALSGVVITSMDMSPMFA